ncbi:MAG: acyl carrier protein [Burkholderiales bacterium]
MDLNQQAIENVVKQKIVEIAGQLGEDASELQNDDIIPATGLIDSAGLLELIAWYEDFYQIRLAQEEITIDNLGTLSTMAEFVLRKKGLV